MNARLPHHALPYAVSFVACVAIDLFYFPPGTTFPDEARLLASATHLAATSEFMVGGNHAWEMPGSAFFFSLPIRMLGADAAILPIRLIQAGLVCLQCALIALTAKRLFGTWRTAAAAWLAALYPFLWFYQGTLLSETLFNTFLLAGVASLMWWRERGARLDVAFVVTVALFTAATYVKATLTILPPLLLAVAAFFHGASWRRTGVLLAAALCLYALFLSPWWIRNATVLHAFVPFTTSGAQNLYLGNNSRNPEGGIAWDRNAEPEVVARIDALPDEVSRQRAYHEVARDYIWSHPGAALRTAVKKLFRFWNIVPNAEEFRSGLYVAVSIASFGSVLVLAILGAFRTRRRWRDLAPIYLIVVYFTFLHALTIASIRYRFPLEPLLIVLAAEPLGELAARFLRRNRRDENAA